MILFSVVMLEATVQQNDDAYDWCIAKFGKPQSGPTMIWSRTLANRWVFTNESDAQWFWLVWR